MMKRIIIVSAILTGISLAIFGTQLETESQPSEAATMNQAVRVKTIKSTITSVKNVKIFKAENVKKPIASSENQKVANSSNVAQTNQPKQESSVTNNTVSETSDKAQPVSLTNEDQPTQVVEEQPAVTNQAVQAASTLPVVSSDIQWLIQHESGGNANAQNGAYYGIGQLSESYYAQYVPGQDYHGNYAVQLEAMQKYIAARYGTVSNAIAHWQANNWY
ncbi:hypothetical protein GCM10025879_14690 [Leuconostoc litchii]|uniref:Peptidoglycan-binding protein n=1 Tax=Leuconostoc litchii TaxID=1981069 RepID=A0A652NDW8_9LACO|nr:peptidoglycan-binding protein [Leuconostoc litchii]TYC46467.1 peptidoglycan-binding protein [Leuconostoc litchii]GMA70223.1 hypothetical protein GCM10025879_14690 [Leuconostoc litchii]